MHTSSTIVTPPLTTTHHMLLSESDSTFLCPCIHTDSVAHGLTNQELQCWLAGRECGQHIQQVKVQLNKQFGVVSSTCGSGECHMTEKTVYLSVTVFHTPATDLSSAFKQSDILNISDVRVLLLPTNQQKVVAW